MRCGSKIACAAIAAVVCASAASAAIFEPLFKVTTVTGDVRVFKPGAEESVPAVEQHAYPYGSRIVVPKWDGRKKSPTPSASISLARDYKFQLSEGSDISVSDNAENPGDKKVIDVRSGKVRTIVTISTIKPGGDEDLLIEAGITAITLNTPLASATRLTERNLISVDVEDGFTTSRFLTESGTMVLAGSQFEIKSMRRNTTVEIYGNKDYTRITNLAGEFTGEIEKGTDQIEKVIFKVRSLAKIWRSYAEIGGKMAVAVMIGSPTGAVKSYVFLEGEAVAADSAVPLAEPTIVEDTVGTADFGAEETASETATSDPAPSDTFQDNFDFGW